MMRGFARLVAASAATLGFVGCVSTSPYNPSYLAAARRPAVVQSDGRVLVVTASQDDAYVYSGNPTSFTGSASNLTMPLGTMVKEAAIAAFADVFTGGVDASTRLTDPARYVLIVAPRLVAFSYEYNLLKNSGLAVTPTAVVTVEVSVLDASGATRWQRRYNAGPVEGSSYIFSASPGEEINKVTHKALYEVFSRAAVDVVHEVLAVPAAPRPG